jgi:hypothetical protein
MQDNETATDKLERLWVWVDDNIIFRAMPRLDAFLCSPWFTLGIAFAAAFVMLSLVVVAVH